MTASRANSTPPYKQNADDRKVKTDKIFSNEQIFCHRKLDRSEKEDHRLLFPSGLSFPPFPI